MKKYWYWITNIEGIGRARINKLIENYITPENIFNENDNVIYKILCQLGIKKDNIDGFFLSKRRLDERYSKLCEYCNLNNIKMVCVDDEDYPQKLRYIDSVPYLLYYKGELPDNNKITISVIGARASDEYGMKITYAFSKVLASNGIQIISGLAMGIDKSAHEGALATGKTFGVLGCGVDICYPQINIDTYMKMLCNGGIISEYAPGTKALRHHFPERNRIISGLSDGILVTQARKKSGSLITVRHALEQGKNIYALPGRITDELSEGCLDIIKEGAKCVTSPEEILEDYSQAFFINNCEKSFNFSKLNNTIEENSLETIEKIVYASLRLDSKCIEDIKNDTGLSLPVIMTALVQLQMKGMIKQTSANHYSIDISNIV